VNTTLFFILIVVIALILGPLVMLKPKPGQKIKEQLRMNARALGLRFTLRSLPKLKTDMEASGVCPVYYLPPSEALASQPEWLLMRTRYEHEANFYKEWDWQTDSVATRDAQALLLGFMPQLPVSVCAISAGPQGVCVFWREQGGEPVLTLIHDMLCALESCVVIEAG